MRSSRGIFVALLSLGIFILPGCRKPPPPHEVVAVATATPSPAGDAIVFVRDGELWMMKWDGSGAGILASNRYASFWFPSGSPKGDDVLAWISHPDGSEDVVRVLLDGHYEVLTAMGEVADPPMKNIRLGNAARYDSKGEQIVYSYNGNIWIMNHDGYDAQTLISDGQSYSPVWSPDDKKIAYVNGKNGHYDLWITDITSHDTYQVTDFQDYSVGQPRWISDGKRIMVTRVQQDESDLVSVLADTDVPLVDSDVITKDNASASGELNKEGKYLVYSSAGPIDPKASSDAPSPIWEIWTADATGKEPKKISTGGGSSPAWIRPSVPSSVVAMPITTMAATPIPTPAPTRAAFVAVRPTLEATPMATMVSVAPGQVLTPAPSAAIPPPAPVNPRPVFVPTLAPTPEPGIVGATKFYIGKIKDSIVSILQMLGIMATPPPPPMQGMQPRVPVAQQASGANPPPGANPGPLAMKTPLPITIPTATLPRPSVSTAVNGKPAPTQAPAKAPPLRLRLRVSFDPDTDQLMLSSLTELKKTASRVRQYADENITIYGPLDRSPLRGTYAGEDDRSKARADQVAAQLAKAAKVPLSSITSLPYTPVVIGAQSPNGIEVHVELK
jgi:hypothetical protein